MTSEYPRDMRGYGRDIPAVRWPGGAPVAVQFVVNYEEGGENNILHGDAASEAFLSEIVGAAAWPGQRHWNMESIYEYGARAGFWRLWRIFTERKLPVTVYGVAIAMMRGREQVAAMQEAGWEIATHGYKWIEYKDIAREVERDHLEKAIALHTELTGSRPLGFYQGRSSMNTVALGMEEGGFLYLADSYADDLPYWVEGPHGPQLITPYTLDANDMRFATPQGFNTGEDFFTYLRDGFDMLAAEGRAGFPKMMSVGLHCRLAGRPNRALGLAKFCDHVVANGGWVATRLDIARHWVRHHPPPGGYRPSRMPRALFVEVYGDVFEHTPAVAEKAHGMGLGPQADSAEGLAAVMVRAMHGLSREAKLALIRAHPDLAGRLAQARALTPDSAKEQQGAGLDALTDAERARFTALNAAYVARFGFPFIMAVKGRTKDEILAAFERRIAHDAEAEFAEALDQIGRIALLRLKDRLP